MASNSNPRAIIFRFSGWVLAFARSESYCTGVVMASDVDGSAVGVSIDDVRALIGVTKGEALMVG